jgi:leucyl aminopeptidase (aminopeptidase T)/predicted small secreted protein
MGRTILTTALAVAVGLSLAACERKEGAGEATNDVAAYSDDGPKKSAEPAVSAAPTDLEQLAQRVVTQSAAVKAGDVVVITGRLQDAELMENIAVHVAKVGGQPLITYSSDRLAKRLFFDVPAEYDSQPDTLGERFAGMADVLISLGNATTENLFEGADPQRMAARGKAGEAVAQAMMKNNVRRVEIGNNLYPTPWRAERFSMDEDALSTMFWSGVNLDYGDLQSRGEEVKAALSGGNEVHLTHPNGTDLKLRIQGRPVLVSDGVISEEDRERGGPAVAVYLPAGEVYTTPVPGTAEGRIVDSGTWFQGKAVENLTLTVSAGKVTAMEGSGPGYAAMKAAYDAVTDPRKDQFGYIDFGINPKITLPADSRMGNWVQAGTVTVGTGANDWAGGDNSVPYGTTVYLPGSTVTLDGKTIVDKGVLKL